MRFIASHADHDAGGLRWGVEPICRVLSEHGYPIAPSTYYDARARSDEPSARARRDDALRSEIARVHADNRRVDCARKVWLQLNRDGIEVIDPVWAGLEPSSGAMGCVGLCAEFGLSLIPFGRLGDAVRRRRVQA